MRRRTAPDTERISLFPFLAVLICTMGSLLVLLVVIAKRAQANAQAERAEQVLEESENDENAQQELAALNARIDELQRIHDQGSKALTDRRDALSHVEDHTRRLRDELRQLQLAAQQLSRAAASDPQGLANLRQKLERLEKQLNESERLLADAKEDASGEIASYSIIPYTGAHRTRRRPLYLECRPTSVVLQPEGIVFEEDDFPNPPTSDTPLAAALRAASEFYANANPNEISDIGRPYPLLIVRPSSIRAYYAARAAMQSWDSDFGYELVEEDWQVEYPTPDPRMAQVVQEAVEIARRRMELMRGKGPSAGAVAARQAPHGPGFGRLVPKEKTGSSARSGGGSGDLKFSPQGAPSAGPRGGPESGGSGSTAKMSSPETNQAGSQGAQSIASVRGKNWALPRATKSSVPLTRPIRVECSADRLVIVPRDGRNSWHVIAIEGSTREVIEKFVSAVWDHMKSWGIAAQGLYWRPSLNVYVKPGGQQRAAELARLLENSGLEVNIQR